MTRSVRKRTFGRRLRPLRGFALTLPAFSGERHQTRRNHSTLVPAMATNVMTCFRTSGENTSRRASSTALLASSGLHKANMTYSMIIWVIQLGVGTGFMR